MSLLHAPNRVAVTTVTLFGLLLGLMTAPALAGVTGKETRTQVAAVGTFGVVATQSAGTPPAGPMTLSYAALTSPPAQYFSAVNIGSLALLAATYSIAVSGGGLGFPTITLTACTAGTWNQGTGVCPGTTTALGSWSASVTTPASSTAAPLVAGSRISIRAALSAGGLLTATTTATVTIAVGSGTPRQVRTGTTTNS